MQPPKLANNPAVIATQLGKTVTTTEQSLTILSAINFSINAGDTVAIIGESGSGKSTLLGLLAGLDTPTTGSVVLADHDLTWLDEEARTRLRSEQVGFVFQSFQLLPGMTALENVMLPLEACNRSEVMITHNLSLNKRRFCRPSTKVSDTPVVAREGFNSRFPATLAPPGIRTGSRQTPVEP